MALAIPGQPGPTVAMTQEDGREIHPFFAGLAARTNDATFIPYDPHSVETKEARRSQPVNSNELNLQKSDKNKNSLLPSTNVQSTLNFERKSSGSQLQKGKATDALIVTNTCQPDGNADQPIGCIQPNDRIIVDCDLTSQPGFKGTHGNAPKAVFPESETRQHPMSRSRHASPDTKQFDQPVSSGQQFPQAGCGENVSNNNISNLSGTPNESKPVAQSHVKPLVEEAANEAISRTPPKKIIRLREDGRLISPKKKDEGAKRLSSGQRLSGNVTRKRTLMITMQYNHNAQTQAAFGKQIDQIISGELRYQSLDHVKRLPALDKEPVSAKPVHPFFAGKLARSQPGSQTPTLLPRSDGGNTPSQVRSFKDSAGPSQTVFSVLRDTKTQGLIPALWPPKEMVHCCQPVQYLSPAPRLTPDVSCRKLKASRTRIGRDEDLLNRSSQHLQPLLSSQLLSRSHIDNFNLPTRRLLTGKQLQALVDEQLSQFSATSHPATYRLRRELEFAMSAFDNFECRTQQWDHGYSPNSIGDVLGCDANLLLLREWLGGLTVNSVTRTSSPSVGKETTKRKAKGRARKKRKISEGLDDFIVSSEDEFGQLDECTDPDSDTDRQMSSLPRLSQRNLRRAKAVVLCGPHGYGKTASVYAVARELDFEVFEINPGTRRSGKDILDRVGDMTRNHLVRQLPEEFDSQATDRQSPIPDASSEVESGKQSTMQAFFKPKSTAKGTNSNVKKIEKELIPNQPTQKPARKQKQSLILLEEVDLLFEEDKHFWSTVMSLLLSTRRPIVMTCNDTRLLPAEDLTDVTYLQLSPPSEPLSVDYLLLLAATEGHLIRRPVMERLLRTHKCDLRASMIHLNFLCQMALGDTKGGLDWMLIRSNVAESTNEKGEPLRVISQDTFSEATIAIATYERENEFDTRTNDEHETVLLEDLNYNWNKSTEEWLDFGLAQEHLNIRSLDALKRFEAAADGLSTADILPGSGFLANSQLDATLPLMTNKERANFPEGYRLLETPTRQDHSGIANRIVLSLQFQASVCRFPVSRSKLTSKLMSQRVSQQPRLLEDVQALYAEELAYVLSPLSMPNPTYLGTTSPSRLVAASSTVLAIDIAPYVRSIVMSDLKLEQNRIELSNLLSEGGQHGTKTRTTRASRAALEGGKKESTRRDRWFRKDLDYKSVVRTAGADWEKAGAIHLQAYETASFDGEGSPEGNGTSLPVAETEGGRMSD